MFHAEKILKAALQAGFRESGALNLLPSGKEPPMPIVAVRSMGLSLSSLVGYCSPEGVAMCSISADELMTLLETGNERFEENEKRIGRFRELIRRGGEEKVREWEDSKSRAERKKREGLLKRKQMLQEQNGADDSDGLLGRNCEELDLEHHISGL